MPRPGCATPSEKQVDDASDDVVKAKQKAERHWEGQSGTAYVGYVKDIIKVSDAHVERIETAASKLDSYSARLKSAKDRMKALRDEDRGGGLTVAGTVIETPPDAVAPTPPAADASDAENNAFKADMGTFQAKVDKIVYNRILADVEAEWTSFVEWIETNLKPVPKTLEAEDVNALTTFVKENAGNLGIAFGLTLGERKLGAKSDALRAAAKELRAARRSATPRAGRGARPRMPRDGSRT